MESLKLPSLEVRVLDVSELERITGGTVLCVPKTTGTKAICDVDGVFEPNDPLFTV
jgi:hypothetical protein